MNKLGITFEAQHVRTTKDLPLEDPPMVRLFELDGLWYLLNDA